MKIEIAQIEESSKELGPGNRFIIWVQGCNLNCHGCLTPSYKEFGKGIVMDANDLLHSIIKNNDIDGVTISGGEPIEQVEAISQLVEEIKLCRNDLNFILYTGYDFDAIKKLDKMNYLKNIDVLICGPYIEKLNDGKGIRGSSNQEIVFITNKMFKHKDYFVNSERLLEISVKDDRLNIIGIPDKNLLTKINNHEQLY